jgi:hypothetical protein
MLEVNRVWRTRVIRSGWWRVPDAAVAAPRDDGQDPTDFLIGMLVPPADYWPRVREVLDRHGILHSVGAAGYLTSRSPAIASPGPERKSSAARQV